MADKAHNQTKTILWMENEDEDTGVEQESWKQ